MDPKVDKNLDTTRLLFLFHFEPIFRLKRPLSFIAQVEVLDPNNSII